MIGALLSGREKENVLSQIGDVGDKGGMVVYRSPLDLISVVRARVPAWALDHVWRRQWLSLYSPYKTPKERSIQFEMS